MFTILAFAVVFAFCVGGVVKSRTSNGYIPLVATPDPLNPNPGDKVTWTVNGTAGTIADSLQANCDQDFTGNPAAVPIPIGATSVKVVTQLTATASGTAHVTFTTASGNSFGPVGVLVSPLSAVVVTTDT